MKKFYMICLCFFILIGCSHSPQKNSYKDISPFIKTFIPIENLEKAGFEHMDTSDFNILKLEKIFYILNTSDSMIVKFNETTPTKSYKLNAQGPGGMLSARSIFLFDSHTIAVFDIQKRCVLFFDLDLNYKNEIRVDPAISFISNRGENFIASGDFPDNKLIALLDRNFEKITTFLTADLEIPFKTKYPPQVFNRLYLLDDHQIAYTYWFYLHKNCVVKIYDSDSKSKIQTLKWEQEHSPTQKDIDTNLNSYSNSAIEKKLDYYIISTALHKKLFSLGYNEILIFKKDGQLIYRNRVPFELIKTNCNPVDSSIFFFDDEKGILVLDLKEL